MNPDPFTVAPPKRTSKLGLRANDARAEEAIVMRNSGVPRQYVEVSKTIRFWETRLVPVRPLRQKHPRTFHVASRLLPTQDRERFVEEWSSWWYDMADRPLRNRAAYVLRILMWVGPKTAWIQRTQKRRRQA
ncbi:hypothetical protein [Streptomyces sp. NPDC004267]|uniref:hypothetical protein n=1 Tax=Streptomyces sp. NPDC004267 TaxID=3364694 RepID=UPI0036A78E34